MNCMEFIGLYARFYFDWQINIGSKIGDPMLLEPLKAVTLRVAKMCPPIRLPMHAPPPPLPQKL
jgi:hypothetical protein